MYKITDYTKKKADKLGLVVKPSTKKNKKIDVYKDDKLIGSVGGIRENGKPYADYPTYLNTTTKSYANDRRRLYRSRHQKDRTAKYSNGWLADRLLW